MNDFLIVPGIHGRGFWLSALDDQGEVIFLGNDTNPYPQENITNEDACQGLLKTARFIQGNTEPIIRDKYYMMYNRQLCLLRHNVIKKYAS